MYVSNRRDLASAEVIDHVLPGSLHTTEQYASNRVECDHGRLKARLGPIRGLRTRHTASAAIGDHAFVQSLRRAHYKLGADTTAALRLARAVDALQAVI